MKIKLLLLLLFSSKIIFSQTINLYQPNMAAIGMSRLGNEFLFVSYDTKLFKSDGINPPVLITQLHPPSGLYHYTIGVNYSNAITDSNFYYFYLSIADGTGSTSYEIWRSDGTVTGTSQLLSWTFASNFMFCKVQDSIFFYNDEYSYLIRSNGIKQIRASSFNFVVDYFDYIYAYKNYLVMQGQDNVYLYDINTGLDTTIIDNIGGIYQNQIFPRGVEINDTLCFFRKDSILLKLAPSLSITYDSTNIGELEKLGDVNGKLILYTTKDSAGINKLYEYFPMTNSLSLIKIIATFNSSTILRFSPGETNNSDSLIYFFAPVSLTGTKLWVTDGTNNGTHTVNFNNFSSYRASLGEPYSHFCKNVLYNNIIGPTALDYGLFKNDGNVGHLFKLTPGTREYVTNIFEFNGDVFISMKYVQNFVDKYSIYKFACDSNIFLSNQHNFTGSSSTLIFPNPASSRITVNSDQSAITVTIYNSMSQVVYKSGKFEHSSLTINSEKFPDGLYVLSINYIDNSIDYRKFVVQH